MTERLERLRKKGLVPVRAKDLSLVRAAGGAVTERPHGPRGERYWTGALVAGAVEVCRQVAHRSGKPARQILRELAEASMVDEVGRFYQTSTLDPMKVNSRIARILGVPVVIGPIRVHPDGRVEISRVKDVWEAATEELLDSLDAEQRLGVKSTLAHFAAETILNWQRKEPS